jgi:hypothetical protein
MGFIEFIDFGTTGERDFRGGGTGTRGGYSAGTPDHLSSFSVGFDEKYSRHSTYPSYFIRGLTTSRRIRSNRSPR